ncbi:MAG: MFS transporter, partial [Clostridiales Family XIII bacterium]|nr:MFS transporter [Clostridiales Family XIII bacterium]
MDDKLSLRTKLAYACGDAGCCFITYISINYYTFYMTNMIGLSLVVASIIVVISRIWDAINDIFVGVMVDRTYTPKGKARPWIKWFLIPLVVISILMFAVPNSLPNSAKAAWCGIAFCIFTLFYTTVNLPYGAMLPLMTKSGSQRTQLATFRMFGAMVGVIGIQIFFLPTVAIIA